MTDITRGSVTVTIVGETGLLDMGGGMFHVTGPVSITNISPGPTNTGPNGTQVNGYTKNLTYDDGAQGLTNIGNWSKRFEVPPALPVTLGRVGENFVAIESPTDGGYTTHDAGVYTDLIWIVRVAALGVAGDLPAPAFYQPWRRPSTIVGEPFDLTDYCTNVFPAAMSATGIDVPTLAALQERVRDVAWLFPGVAGTSVRTYGGAIPYGWGVGDNYGLYVSRTTNAAVIAALLTSDVPTREALLGPIIRAGWTVWNCACGEVLGNSRVSNLKANGGIMQFYTLPVHLALHATGRATFMHTFMDWILPNQIGSVIGPITQDFIDDVTTPHRRDLGPVLSMIRTITSIGESGGNPVINCARHPNDLNRWLCAGNVIRRVSDGAEATILNDPMRDINDGEPSLHNFVIDAQPAPPFSPGDHFTIVPASVPVLGGYDYALEARTETNRANGRGYEGSAQRGYGDTQGWAGDAIFAAAIGNRTGNVGAMIEVFRGVTSGRLGITDNWITTYSAPSGGSWSLESTFLAAHAATLGLD